MYNICMQRKVPLTTGEVYHVFNRGAHKRSIFYTDGERQRFQALLLVANQKEPVHLANLLTKYKGPSFIKIFKEESPDVSKRIVDVLGYCLMPNHVHIVLRQRVDDGITTFMRKVGTAYSMYFNAKHGHGGTLWQGRFKSLHVPDDDYLGWLIQYVHLNPLDLIEPGWRKEGYSVRNRARAEKFLRSYAWSSYMDYAIKKRPETNLLSQETYDDIDFSEALSLVQENIKDGPLYF